MYHVLMIVSGFFFFKITPAKATISFGFFDFLLAMNFLPETLFRSQRQEVRGRSSYGIFEVTGAYRNDLRRWTQQVDIASHSMT